MIEFLFGIVVGVTAIALMAMSVVMMGNWRYNRMAKNERMADAWLQRQAKISHR